MSAYRTFLHNAKLLGIGEVNQIQENLKKRWPFKTMCKGKIAKGKLFESLRSKQNG
jgi:hypothetical protein